MKHDETTFAADGVEIRGSAIDSTGVPIRTQVSVRCLRHDETSTSVRLIALSGFSGSKIRTLSSFIAYK
jgi:hypothetical protein